MVAASVTSTVHSDYVKHHNQHVIKPPLFTSRAVKKYLGSRWSSLFVSKEERSQYSWLEILNPFGELHLMSLRNWNYFFMGFAAWTWDAVDFFAVSLNTKAMAHSFGVSVKDITWGITLVLMLRSVGAFIFGYWGDKYGRKWPYMINLSLLVVLQIGTGFVKTYQQFLGVRALFGIAMGGIYGFSLATALDDAPVACRGILSGIFQEGYAFGYLLAVVFNRAITDNSPHGWRAFFWFAACPPVLFLIWRWCLPETDAFKRQQEAKLSAKAENADLKWYQLSPQSKKVFKTYWLIMIYLVLLMAGFNFMSHGSQDLYPTLLSVQLQYNVNRSTVTNVVANLGAICGGMIFGHSSTFIGRRLSIIIACVLGGACIYPWAFVHSSAINAGAFFMQFGVQGAWGVIPVYLSELSPPAHRSLVVGLSYQLGNLASSASSTIESTIGEKFPIIAPNGQKAYDYGKVMSIFIACVFVYVIFVSFMGPENRGADFNVDRDEIMESEVDEAAENESQKEVKLIAECEEKVKFEHQERV